MPGKVFRFEIFRFFVLPFIIMALVILTIAHFDINSQNNNIYDNMFEYAQSIVDSFIVSLKNSDTIEEIIIKQIDDKMFLIADKVITNENDITNEYLDSIIGLYDIDEINVYDISGKLVNSNKRNLIGFQSYEGHAVYDFLMGSDPHLSEDIRVGEIDGSGSFKLILKRSPSGSVIQVGISVTQLNMLLESFSAQNFIYEQIKKESIDNIFFTNMNYDVVAKGNDNFGSVKFDEKGIGKHFNISQPQMDKDLFGTKAIHICSPVIYNAEKIGVLTIVWSSSVITKNMFDALTKAILRFLLIIIILGTTVFYGYKKRKESMLNSYLDYTTKLPNDNYLKLYLEKRIKSLNKNNLALVLVKLANLDTFNSSFGLDKGDILLQEIASMLNKNIKKEDILFKFGGSKYVIALNDYSSIDYIKNTTTNILSNFNDPLVITNKESFLKLNISINIVDDNKSVKEILDTSFLGIELIEEETDKNYIMMTEELKIKKERELKIESAIKYVIDNGKNDILSLNFQPVYNLASGKITGLEVLARMKLKDLGPISPIEFIKIAEEKQLIHQLGLVILEEALNAQKRIDMLINNKMIIGINISRLQLYRSDFVPSITKIIEKCDFDWSRINFEITETTFVKDYSLIKENIQNIKNKGSRIALDDFGTHYSTLSELKNLNLDYLKIDKLFINHIGVIDEEELITEEIIKIGKKHGLRVVAEGIETEEQLAYLKKQDCELGQGYYLSKPLNEVDVIELLKKEI